MNTILRQGRIGEILVRQGWVNPENVHRALELQAEQGGYLGEILIKRGWIDREKLLKGLALQFGIPYVCIRELNLQREAVQAVPKRLAYEYQMMPLVKQGLQLLVAISDPIDQLPVYQLQEAAKIVDIRTVLAHPEDIRESLNRYYGPEGVSHAFPASAAA